MFLWTACVTPFDYSVDNIDFDSLEKLLTIQAEAGNGIVLLGSTGEGLSLIECEKRELVEFACKLNLNTQILIGVPGINLHHSLEWIDFCNDMPIDGYLMTTPVYTKPGVVGQTLWFEKLLEKALAPAMIYNIPSRAGIRLHPQTVHNLSTHDKFWAIKDSSGIANTLSEYKKAAPNIKVFCGDDDMLAIAVAMGAEGLVSVASNIWPDIVRKYVKRCLNEEKLPQEIWLQICEALFTASNPIPTKILLQNIGLIRHKTVRLPLSTDDLSSMEKLCHVNELAKILENNLR